MEYPILMGAYWGGLAIFLGANLGELDTPKSKLSLLRGIALALVKSVFWPIALIVKAFKLLFDFWTQLPDE